MGTTTYTIEPHFVPGARQGRVTLPNGWRISVVSGPAGSGLHGVLADGTAEVAIYNPLGRMVGDPLPYQNREQIRGLLVRLARM